MPSDRDDVLLELLAGLSPELLRTPAEEAVHNELTDERLFVTELLNESAVPYLSVARCRVLPGVTTQLHALSVNEWYLIEAGLGRMRLGDGEPFDVGVRDAIQIPAGTAQQISNPGDDDLVFLCVCVPRFRPDVYRSLEDGAPMP